MPDVDPRLGLALPLVTDPFQTSDLRANWEKLTQHPGVLLIENIGQFPDWWGSQNRGMLVYQADEDVYWRWSGTMLQRAFPKGLLRSPSGDPGVNRRSQSIALSATFDALVQVTVDVPAGGLHANVHTAWGEVDGGSATFAIFRNDTKITEWTVADGAGGGYSFLDLDTPLGPTTYDLRARIATGAPSLLASVAAPTSITVVEV